MPDPSAHNVTALLRRVRAGDRGALDELMPLVYDDLRRQAAHHLKGERHRVTLQPTALLHEAYLKLADNPRIAWQNRTHFFAVTANFMRRILVEHARARKAQKRGDNATHMTLSSDLPVSAPARDIVDILAFEALLNRLEQMDARQAQVVEMRVFGGLTVEETAEVLELSPRTIKTDWQLARAWLRRELRA